MPMIIRIMSIHPFFPLIWASFDRIWFAHWKFSSHFAQICFKIWDCAPIIIRKRHHHWDRTPIGSSMMGSCVCIFICKYVRFRFDISTREHTQTNADTCVLFVHLKVLPKTQVKNWIRTKSEAINSATSRVTAYVLTHSSRESELQKHIIW